MNNGIPELEFISWTQFEAETFELAKKLDAYTINFTLIVSISRGGHVISRILSDLLGLPIFNVSIQSYQGLKQEELVMNQKLHKYLQNEHVLLVDEVVDTGKSLERAVSYLNKLRCESVFSTALHVKPHTTFWPDMYTRETDKWVIYPYEVRESYESLMPVFKKHGKNGEDLKKVLIEGGMSKEVVEWTADSRR